MRKNIGKDHGGNAMYGIELLMKEHLNIIAFTEYMKNCCCAILEGADVDTAQFMECIDFARSYADKHHHGKEEQILFRHMLENPGSATEKLVRNGMLVEHEFGRFHITELENALKLYTEYPCTKNKLGVITHAAAYVDLLQRHIQKEDNVCYTYAQRMLSNAEKNQIDAETKAFEEEAEQNGIPQKYLAWLDARN